MGWLSLFSGALRLVNFLAEALARRQLIDQGRVQQIAEDNADALENARKALAVRRNVPKYFAGMPDDDPDRRD